ncbi:MAG: hypothetical protein AAF566_13435 [Pseudomonadota bacterium]
MTAETELQTTGSERSRIAVLPFCGDARDPLHGSLGDALAQEVTRALSRTSMCDVISHFSSRSIDPRMASLPSTSAALGAEYLVTGRLLTSDQRLFLDVELHDATRDCLIWTERFRTETTAFFSAETDVIACVAAAVLECVLSQTVTIGPIRPLPSASTHALVISAISLMHHMARGNFARAYDHLKEVTERASSNAAPRAWLAHWHVLRIFQGWGSEPALDGHAALENAARACRLDPDCALSLTVDAHAKMIASGDLAAAENGLFRALAINPSSAIATQLMSLLYAFKDEGEDAVRLSERALLLSPLDPRRAYFEGLRSTAYLAKGDTARALEIANHALSLNPRHISAHRARIIALQVTGRSSDARRAAEDLLRRDPSWRVEGDFAHRAVEQTLLGQEWANALWEAGIPRRQGSKG